MNSENHNRLTSVSPQHASAKTQRDCGVSVRNLPRNFSHPSSAADSTTRPLMTIVSRRTSLPPPWRMKKVMINQ